jgi:outer membrane lipoprotein-sorting protein
MLRAGRRISFLPALLACLLTIQCGGRGEKTEPQPLIAVEPETYSARVAQTIERGEQREVIETRVARRGSLFRQEWIERGERRALIIRPDLGRKFLMSLDRRLYVESVIDDQSIGGIDENYAKEIDRVFDSQPARVETLVLVDQTIDGYVCQVVERRAVTGEGKTEITRLYLARDLAGLALRIEAVSSPGIRVITERRDVRTDVSEEEFTVPADFKRALALDP